MTDANTPDPAAVAAPEPEEIPVEETPQREYTPMPPAPPEAEVQFQGAPVTRMSLRERFLEMPAWVRVLAVIAILIFAGLLVVSLLGFRGCTAKGSNTELGVEGRMEEPPASPAPAVPNGIQSWTEYAAAANILDEDKTEGNIMYDSLALLHPEQGDIRKAVAGMVSLEASCQTFMYVAPKNAAFINTDYLVLHGKLDFRFFEDKTKDDKTSFLTFADGTVAVKAGCANAVRFHKTVPAVKKVEIQKRKQSRIPPPPPPPKKEEKCPPAPAGFTPRTPTGGSRVFQAPQENQSTAKATNPAPAIVRGEPDAIAADQTARSGTVVPTPHGAVSPIPPPAGPPADDGAGDVTSGTVSGLW